MIDRVACEYLALGRGHPKVTSVLYYMHVVALSHWRYFVTSVLA